MGRATTIEMTVNDDYYRRQNLASEGSVKPCSSPLISVTKDRASQSPTEVNTRQCRL